MPRPRKPLTSKHRFFPEIRLNPPHTTLETWVTETTLRATASIFSDKLSCSVLRFLLCVNARIRSEATQWQLFESVNC